MAPTITVSTEMTIATMGRLMKKRDTLPSRLPSLAVDDRHDCPVSDLQQPFDDDPFASLQTIRHDPVAPDAIADRHRPNRDLVVVADDSHLVTTLQLGDRALRNQKGAGR